VVSDAGPLCRRAALPARSTGCAEEHPENYYQSSRYLSGTLNVDVGFAVLTSVTGYTEGKWKQSNDPDASELTLATNPYWTLDQFQWSEELRLASKPSDSPLSWIVGGYFFREKVGQTFQFIDTGLNSASPFTDTFIFTNGGTYTTESYAAFGQADVDLGKTSVGVPVTLTAGIRYTHDNKQGFDFLNFTLPRIPFTTEPTKNFDKNWSQTTFKVGRTGGRTKTFWSTATTRLATCQGAAWSATSPASTAREGQGDRGRLQVDADGDRLLFNAAAYHQKITDMQVFVQDITGSRHRQRRQGARERRGA
jgi:iron complex outermembrane receptor protein